MRECDCRHSCRTCIWNEQCEDEKPCEFYDDGRNIIDLSDDEIQAKVENDRVKFTKEYENYVSEDYDERKHKLYSDCTKNLS